MTPWSAAPAVCVCGLTLCLCRHLGGPARCQALRRRLGAAALDLAWVAAGRFDGYWESGLKPWDTAAGLLLVKEAGGYVTDYRGADRAQERNEFLACNDALHSKLHKLVAGALR